MHTRNNFDQDKFIRALFFAVPIAIIIYCFGSGISGNDFWWHIKVGEYILDKKAVPTTDIFSWYGTELGISWTAHEWLADVIYFLIYKNFGSFGIFLFSIISAVLLYIALWSVARCYVSRNILFSELFFSLFGVITSLFFYGRPHVFSFFFLFLELKILYDFFENQNSKKIYFVPIIATFWSNLHGGSSNLSYILCIIFLICGVFEFSFGRIESKRMSNSYLIKLTVITVLTIGGILINPIGTRVLVYPYNNLSDEISMTVISEWAAPDAKIIGNLILYFLPIVIMSIGVISEKTVVRAIDLLVMLAFLFLFFRSARFIILWYIAATFYAFRYLPQLKVKQIKKTSEKILIGILITILYLPFVFGVIDINESRKKGNIISTVVSDDAIAAIKKDSPSRIFNDYNIGEALIYNDIPVFFDARADLYAQEHIMEDGVSLLLLEQANRSEENSFVDVDKLIKKYDFDAIAILKSRPLYSYLISHPERYLLLYEDSNAAYYRVLGGMENE